MSDQAALHVVGRAVPDHRPTWWARAGERWGGALFVAPFLLVFFTLLVYPLLLGIWVSLQRYDLFDGSAEFAGLENYLGLWNDSLFLGSLRNTLVFVAGTVPVFTIVGLLLALALNRPTRGAAILRGIFFATSVLSVTIVTIIWKVVLMPGRGLLPTFMERLGLEPLAMLSHQDWALFAVGLTTVWWILGLPMILFLAALQQIPDDLYEAAALDNASPWTTLRRITLPSIRRTTVVVVIFQVVLQFQVFGQTLLLTRGGPNNASRSLVQFIYERGFRDWDVGYAAAASEVLFVIIALVALVQFVLIGRRKAEA